MNEYSLSNLNELKNNLNNLNEEELIIYLNKLIEKWDLNKIGTYDLIIKNLNINNPYNLEEINDKYLKEIYEIINLYMIFSKKNIMTIMDNNDENFLKFNKLLEIIHYSEIIIRSQARLFMITDPNYQSFMNDDINIEKYSPQDFTNNTPYQNLLLYLLHILHQNNYRRYNETIQVPILNKKNNYTYSWKKKMEIQDFVFQKTQKEINFEQWKNLTSSKDNAKHVTEFLKKCDDIQFLEIKKDRHIFSFENGLLICNYEDKNVQDDFKLRELFVEYDNFEKYNLASDLVAIKHFNIELEYKEVNNWKEIPTLNLQSIIDYQFKKNSEYEEISRWLYVFLGRMLYNLNELDYWQVMVFLKGMAGSGKSTIITKIVKEFYDPEDVGQLSNDGEKIFGLSAFYDKKIFIAPEIKADFSLPQAQFQGMISGEDISVSIKNKTARTIAWNTPGIMAGNEVPNFTDNSGSVSRRLVVFDFLRKVDKKVSDPMLGKKLLKELPYIIRKSNLAYLEAIKLYGKKDVWLFLPNYFKKTQEEMSEKTNSLLSFLNSGNIIFDSNVYIHERVFKKEFNNFCRENNLGTKKFDSDFYSGPFIDASEKNSVEIKVVNRVKKLYPRNSYGKRIHGSFILGIDFINNDSDNDENEND